MSAQPISESFHRIMLGVISNAAPKSEQKAIILIAYEEGVLNARETEILMKTYELAGE